MVIHMVWLGDNCDQKIIDHTKNVNPDCEVKIWQNYDLIPKSWENTFFNYARAPQLKSDLIRLCALREYGGLYIDFDCYMKTNARIITQDWHTLTIPAMCNCMILPGNILYCPKDWAYWDCVDDYVTNYNDHKITILTFNHFLYMSLPDQTFAINRDCEKFPSEERYITNSAQIIRYRSKIPYDKL
jgi:hypothetical protein